MTAAPHLSRPFRRWGHWIEGLAAFSLVALGATSPTGALMALLLPVAAAATIYLLLASPLSYVKRRTGGAAPGSGDADQDHDKCSDTDDGPAPARRRPTTRTDTPMPATERRRTIQAGAFL